LQPSSDNILRPPSLTTSHPPSDKNPHYAEDETEDNRKDNRVDPRKFHWGFLTLSLDFGVYKYNIFFPLVQFYPTLQPVPLSSALAPRDLTVPPPHPELAFQANVFKMTYLASW